jgi:hypothetical protein
MKKKQKTQKPKSTAPVVKTKSTAPVKTKLFKIDPVKLEGTVTYETNPTQKEIDESINSIFLMRLCDILKDLETSLKSTDTINGKEPVTYLIEMFDKYTNSSSFKTFLSKFGFTINTSKSALLSFAIKIEDSLIDKYCISLPINAINPTPKEMSNIEDQVKSIDGMIYDATNADLSLLLGKKKKDEFLKQKKMYYTRASLFDPHTATQNMFMDEIVSLNDAYLTLVGLSYNKRSKPSTSTQISSISVDNSNTHTGKKDSDFNDFIFFGLDFKPNIYSYSKGNASKNSLITKSTDVDAIDKLLWAKELGDTLQSFFVTQNTNKNESIICLTNDRGFTFNCMLSNANFVFSEKSGSSKANNKRYLNYYHIKDDVLDPTVYNTKLKLFYQPVIDNFITYIELLKNDLTKAFKTTTEIQLESSPNIVLILDATTKKKIKDLISILETILSAMETMLQSISLKNDTATISVISLKDQMNLVKNFFELFANNISGIKYKYKESIFTLPSVLSTNILRGNSLEIQTYIDDFIKLYGSNNALMTSIYGDKFCTFINKFTKDKELTKIYINNTYIKFFGKYYNKVTKTDIQKGGVNTRKTVNIDSVLSNTYNELFFDLTCEKAINRVLFLLNENLNHLDETVIDKTNTSKMNMFKPMDYILDNNNKIVNNLLEEITMPTTLKRSISNKELKEEIDHFNNKIDKYVKINKKNSVLNKYKLIYSDPIINKKKSNNSQTSDIPNTQPLYVSDFEYDYVKIIKDLVYDKNNKSPEEKYRGIKYTFDSIYSNYYSDKLSLFEFRIYQIVLDEYISYKDYLDIYPSDLSHLQFEEITQKTGTGAEAKNEANTENISYKKSPIKYLSPKPSLKTSLKPSSKTSPKTSLKSSSKTSPKTSPKTSLKSSSKTSPKPSNQNNKTRKFTTTGIDSSNMVKKIRDMIRILELKQKYNNNINKKEEKIQMQKQNQYRIQQERLQKKQIPFNNFGQLRLFNNGYGIVK